MPSIDERVFGAADGVAADAHGIGVVGNRRGSIFAGDVPADVPLQMGTLSKAIGCWAARRRATKDATTFR
jgi:hypothetical protein